MSLALVVGPVLAGLAGMVLELCLRPTYGKPPLYGLLLTFGAAWSSRKLIRLVWGTGEKNLPRAAGDQRRLAARRPDLLEVPLLRRRLRDPRDRRGLAVPGADARTAPVIKAGAHDSEMVRALGFDLARLRLLVFGFGAALAGLAGVIMVPIWGLRPHVGVDVVIPAFLIIVIGGVGSFWGAVIAALLVGLAVGITGAYAAGLGDDVDVPAADRRPRLPRARPARPQERAGDLTP